MAMKKRGLLTSLNFSLEPSIYYVPGFVETGRTVDLLKEHDAFLSLVNRGHNNLKVNIVSVSPSGRIRPGLGFENTPNPAWMTVTEENPRYIKTRSINDVTFKLHIPDDEKYKGKRYLFLLKCEIEGLNIPLETYSRVYILLKDDDE